MKEFYAVCEVVWAWLCGVAVRVREKANGFVVSAKHCAMATDPGIDGILVTVGLCIIALLLCVVMKDSLATFITSIVGSMQTQATSILTGK
ncbi:MAG: hypothetical protein II477_02210 [Lachnospiraceae bacterium]|nr:hypothetical protein [Lachnospiraceae bacterium]MBQ2099868.1 hypothetical protein [Lachnospiraceae bacterium]